MKNKEYTSIRHILKYIGIFGSVEVLKILANLSRGKITAFFLGPFGAGLIAIYQNIIEVIRSCTNLGLEVASIQQLSEIDTENQKDEVEAMAKTIRTWSMAVAILDVLVCIGIAFIFGNVFFNDGNNHQQDILMLIPLAFLAPLTAGECAILKGTHKLKRVATVELLCAVSTALCALALYWTMGLKGIIPTLNLCVAIEASVHIYFCTQIFPYRIDFLSPKVWKRGISLLKFGIPYAAAAIMTAITTTTLYHVIRTTDEVGFYKSGYALIMYYVGVIFSSYAIDYFPRLTSVCHDTELKTQTVNKQIHVSFTVTTPLVMCFLLALPIIIPLLYTEEFMPMAGICVMAGLFQLHRAVALPLEYVSLAHGHSWVYLILESTYNLMVIGSAFLMYGRWGVAGMGMALSLVAVANTVVLGIVNHCFYHISISRKNWITIISGSCLVAVTMLLCSTDNMGLRFGAGIPMTLLTAAYSYATLKREIKEGE
ncbi:MAG: oligosaccharide flippase family protein [Bacteroidaceae bacterium]|nr:oligosaccharide flippase family protein [Bacteroidaceae bacterium]